MKTSKLMWVIYFIASFAAFHYLLIAFNVNLLAFPLIAGVPNLVRIVSIIFGLCGLVSLITLFMGCKECK
ncbi:hypothetical protein ACFLYU_03215 [Candidatus Dependentiae bacterium]